MMENNLPKNSAIKAQANFQPNISLGTFLLLVKMVKYEAVTIGEGV